jgi:segregation and condensation protein B
VLDDEAAAVDGAETRSGAEFGVPVEPGGADGPDVAHEWRSEPGGPQGDPDEVPDLDQSAEEAAAYRAGAADAEDALRGAAGRRAAEGDEPAGAEPTTRPAAESIGDAGPAEAGSAVPVQGRRRRGDAGASGEAASRTSESGDPRSARAAETFGDGKSASDGGAESAAETSGGGKSASQSVGAARRSSSGTSASDGGAESAAAVPALEEDADLAAALEAIMLVVDEPVGELQLAQILEQPTERVATVLEDLSARYTAAGHGFDLRRAAGGWRLYTRPEYAAYVERFVLDGQSVRLTQAALETLAVVAYKQPVTRSRISAIRGVNCDGVMRTLATRGLIEECGTEGETGAHLYRTTALFLEKLGLNSVDQLPPLAPFLPDDVEEVLDATG